MTTSDVIELVFGPLLPRTAAGLRYIRPHRPLEGLMERLQPRMLN